MIRVNGPWGPKEGEHDRDSVPAGWLRMEARLRSETNCQPPRLDRCRGKPSVGRGGRALNQKSMPRSGADRSARLAENDLTPYFATTGTVLRQTGTNSNIDNDGDASFRLSMNFHPLPTFRSGPWRAGLGRRGRRARTQNPVSPRSRLCPDSLNQGAARMRALATRRPVDSWAWVLDVTSAVGTANRGMLSCSWHPIATRRWWLGELVPFPSTVLPRDLRAWLWISAPAVHRDTDRRRGIPPPPCCALPRPFLFMSPRGRFSSIDQEARLFAAWDGSKGRGVSGRLLGSRFGVALSIPGFRKLSHRHVGVWCRGL